MTNDKFTAVGTNIAEKATMIWNVADIILFQQDAGDIGSQQANLGCKCVENAEDESSYQRNS